MSRTLKENWAAWGEKKLTKALQFFLKIKGLSLWYECKSSQPADVQQLQNMESNEVESETISIFRVNNLINQSF
jgi:hypothetical protein